MERWERNFLTLWPSLLLVSLGLMGVLPTLPLYIEERFGLTDPGEVERWTALVFGAAPFCGAFVGPLWGLLGDRMGRRAMVLRALLGISISLALMPLAPTPATLAGLRMLQGSFAGYIAPSMALIAADVPREFQGRVIARLQLALAFGLALGPATAAEVTAWWGRSAVFWVGSGLALLAALPVLLVVREDPEHFVRRARGVTPPAGAVADDGESGPGRDPGRVVRSVTAMLLLVFLVRFSLHMVEPFTALWVRELGPLWGLVPEGAGLTRAVDRTTALAFTLLAVGQLLFMSRWGWLGDRFGPLRCLAAAAFALALVLGGIGLVTGIVPYLVLRLLAAVFMAGLMSLAYAAVGKRVDGSRKAFAFAFVQSGMHLGLALGPLFGSVVAASSGGLRGVFATAAVLLACAGGGLLALRRLERATGGGDR